MVQKITYIINADDKDILKQFIEILSLSGVQTKHIKSSDKYDYFESCWSDIDIQKQKPKCNSRNAGAKPKTLLNHGKPVTCGLIYALRHQKHLSDAEIGSLFDVSESTVCRRRKKHLSDNNFYENSATIF